ncbi:hypothetical protein GW17_00057308 [Ensete ventricosum]|nr:hypothetical protein GW17_00057308 [Ensete ventricosum]
MWGMYSGGDRDGNVVWHCQKPAAVVAIFVGEPLMGGTWATSSAAPTHYIHGPFSTSSEGDVKRVQVSARTTLMRRTTWPAVPFPVDAFPTSFGLSFLRPRDFSDPSSEAPPKEVSPGTLIDGRGSFRIYFPR